MSGYELGPVEARILGCLLEKQKTTPDAYPLSLNALRLACNQSTNRDPVVEYDEAMIRDGLHRLERRGLVRLASGAGSRAAKFRHLLAQALPMDDAEQALICLLLLRGAQTPGELKQRGERMHAFGSLEDLHATLDALIARELVARYARRPGQKEDRYGHLLGADDDGPPALADGGGGATAATAGTPGSHTPGAAAPPPVGPAGDLEALAARVARLERELAELRAAVAANGSASGGDTGGPQAGAPDETTAPVV